MPKPEELRPFHREFGLEETTPGRFSTKEGGEQLSIVAAPRRFVEYYSDLDVIIDDEAWKVAASIAVHLLAAWGPAVPPSFLAPDDIVARARGGVPSRSRSRSRSQSASSSVGNRPLKARHQFASSARRSGCEYMMHAGLVQWAACS